MIKNLDLSPLDKLVESDIPLWGSMSPQHMVEHLCLVVQSSNSTLETNDFITPIEKLQVAKRFLMSDRSFPKNFVNPIIGKGVKPLICSNLESSKNELTEEVKKFFYFFEAHPKAKPINATFGPLNMEEWIQFHTKHFKHHFEQFGLII